MSWEIVLSKYKRSLFGNDIALKTIILLDRNGVSTEDEISESIKVSKDRLNSCLHDLKLNNLIEYEEDFIRLTSTGCKILDRFDFSDIILEDIIYKIEDDNNRKNDLKTILKFYREESPYCFHNTNYSIRIWLGLLNDISKNTEFEINKEEELGSCKSILYRDIRNWVSHSPNKSYFKDLLNNELKILLFTKKPDVSLCESKFNDSHNYSISYLAIIDDSIEKGTRISKIKTNFNSIYKDFYTAQCVSFPNEWFELGFSLKNNLPSSKRFSYLKNYLTKLEINLNEKISVEMKENSSFKNRLLFTRNWLEKSDNILECLSISNSISEFCKYSNLEEFKAVETLNQIKNKCTDLLEK